MATLADIKVTLTLETDAFYNQLEEVSRELERFASDMGKLTKDMTDNMNKNMGNFGNSNTMTESTKQMSETFQESFEDMGESMRHTQRHMRRMGKHTRQYAELTEEEIGKLPQHLQELARAFKKTGQDIHEMAKSGGKDMDAFTDSVLNSKKGADQLDKMSKSGKDALKMIQDMYKASKAAQMAALGMNESGTAKLSTEDAQREILAFQKRIQETVRELEKMRDAGDMSAYTSGMKEVENATRDFQQTLRSTSKGGKDLEATLRRLGLYTEGMGNAAAMAMERYRDAILGAHQHFMDKSTEAQGMMKLLDEQKFGGLQKSLLGIGDSMERAARKGNAMQLALDQLGKNASMADLLKRTQEINKGIARMTALSMGMAWVNAGLLYGMILLSNHVDGRLIPAFDELKSVWADALTPFIKAFTDFALFVMDGAKALGELAKSFAEAHPQLSAMLWGFVAITSALLLLLAPLAVCIGLTGGLRAAFALLWGVIGKFVLGFLSVLPVAALIAAAIVIVIAVFHNMYKASENLRNAISTGWAAIKDTILTALEPIAGKWEELKKKFFEFMSLFTSGEANTMGEFWTWLGDKVAVAVTFITTNLLPILKVGFETLATVIGLVIDGIILAMDWLAQQWATHGDTIMMVIQWIWDKVSTAFQAVYDFIVSIMPQVVDIVSKAWGVIQQVIDLAIKYVVPLIEESLSNIWNIMQAIWPLVSGVVETAWTMIKGTIKIGLTVIEGLIDVVSKLLKGDWKGAWDSATDTLKKVGEIFSDTRDKMKKIIKDAVDKVVDNLKDLKLKSTNIGREIKEALVNKFNELKDKAAQKMGEMVDKIRGKLKPVTEAMKNPFETAWNYIKGIPGRIAKAFSSLKIGIPKPKLPSLSVSTKTLFGGEGGIPATTVPVLKWNAKGNIFNGPSILGGGQGVAEMGAEGVIPLEHKRYMKPFSSAVAAHLKSSMEGNSDRETTINVNFNEPVVIKEQADLQKLVDEMARRERAVKRAKGIFSYQS